MIDKENALKAMKELANEWQPDCVRQMLMELEAFLDSDLQEAKQKCKALIVCDVFDVDNYESRSNGKRIVIPSVLSSDQIASIFAIAGE